MAANSYSGFPYGDGTQYNTPAAAASVTTPGAPPFPYAAPTTAYPAAPYHTANPPPPPYPGYGYGRPMPPAFNHPYDAGGASQQTKIHYSAPPTRNIPPVARAPNHHPHHHRERQKMQPPRPKQLHYCEVCKISCSCPRAYTEHLESKKHKKREAGLNAPAGSQPVAGQNKYHCELCDVICTDKDAYAAHVRGSKHQKVVKLHTKLGKPIPQDDPLKFSKTEVKKDDTAVADGASTTGNETATIKEEDDTPEVKPVGAEYIEEIKEDGKVLMFNCKLCDCKFSDPNAKEMHMKGRRHRLQYKRKVEPDLVVDIKPTARQKRLAMLQSDMWNVRRNPVEIGGWPPRRLYNDFDMGPGGMLPRPMPTSMRGPGGGPPFMGWGGFAGIIPNVRPEGINDFYTIARHSEIYPKEKSLQNIHEIVSNTERALRLVSDVLAGFGESSDPNGGAEQPAGNDNESNNGMAKVSFQQVSDNGKVRVLQGVMRVGPLAKGLLLQGDTCVQLVVLCSEKPKLTLLERVASELSIQLKALSTANKVYSVTVSSEDGSVLVTDGTMTVKVSLTSPLFREEDLFRGVVKQEPNDEVSDFPRDAALQALAELRHSKWFQAKAATLPSCVLVIRVMRDICQRFVMWQALSQWAIELLVEKVISSARFPLGPSDSLRRIMEAISTGLLINGPGLLDPCEKEPRDVIQGLTPQQREDVTHSAQLFLRQIAFKQIYKILGMEQMSTSKLKWKFWLLNRKRTCEDNDESETDGKLLKTTPA